MSQFMAVRQGDFVSCPICRHTRVSSGSANVLIEGQPAARLGDHCNCGGGLTNAGSHNVYINGVPVAVRAGHATDDHQPVTSARSIFIGTQTQHQRTKRSDPPSSSDDSASSPSDSPLEGATARLSEDENIVERMRRLNLNPGDPVDVQPNGTFAYTDATPPLPGNPSFYFPEHQPTTGTLTEIFFQPLPSAQRNPPTYEAHQPPPAYGNSTGEVTHEAPPHYDNLFPPAPPAAPPSSPPPYQFSDGSLIRGRTCTNDRPNCGHNDHQARAVPTENARGFYERQEYGDYLYIATSQPPHDVREYGFDANLDTSDIPQMIDGDRVRVAWDGPFEAAEEGVHHYRSRGGVDILYIYRIDARHIRGANVSENFMRGASGLRHVPEDVDIENGTLTAVHFDQSQVPTNSIQVVSEELLVNIRANMQSGHPPPLPPPSHNEL